MARIINLPYALEQYSTSCEQGVLMLAIIHRLSITSTKYVPALSQGAAIKPRREFKGSIEGPSRCGRMLGRSLPQCYSAGTSPRLKASLTISLTMLLRIRAATSRIGSVTSFR